mmetsp:Transcript_13829/g.39156  ORF Transcript_13829/g.39156 Transcript_13829/m.39156 type:complete len:228 (-) Transcript_13829:707-1390(-)
MFHQRQRSSCCCSATQGVVTSGSVSAAGTAGACAPCLSPWTSGWCSRAIGCASSRAEDGTPAAGFLPFCTCAGASAPAGASLALANSPSSAATLAAKRSRAHPSGQRLLPRAPGMTSSCSPSVPGNLSIRSSEAAHSMSLGSIGMKPNPSCQVDTVSLAAGRQSLPTPASDSTDTKASSSFRARPWRRYSLCVAMSGSSAMRCPKTRNMPATTGTPSIISRRQCIPL